MAAKMVKCAKLGRDLPGIDPDTPAGDQALKMTLLIAGPAMRKRVADSISAEAMAKWNDHMLMVINEYRLDPTSDESNPILAQHMEAFFFGEQADIPNYVPPEEAEGPI
ncbi:MAG: Fe(2+)-trafficking protein [Phycisphaerales bacterium]|nr:Fe(2+)-trafficking protein [Phycisphaerales bacterium]